MTKIAIVYGTSGGNTRLVCQKIAKVLEKKGHTVDMHRVIETSEHVFDEYKTFILASPTYGHGLLDPHIIPFYESLEGNIDLSKKQFAVVGLGDDKYDADYNVESVHILTDFAKRHGGKIIFEPLFVNRCPIPALQTIVQDWSEGFHKVC